MQLNKELLNSLIMNSPYINPQVYQQNILSPQNIQSPTKIPSRCKSHSIQKRQSSIQKPQISNNNNNTSNFNDIKKKKTSQDITTQNNQSQDTENEIPSPLYNQKSRKSNLPIIEQKSLVESSCKFFLNKNNKFDIERLSHNNCCFCFGQNDCQNYRVQFQSPQLQTATVKFRADDCLTLVCRNLSKLFLPAKALAEGESIQLDSLKIEVYDGKGSVYLHNYFLGTFQKKSPSLFSKIFSNKMIELEIIPYQSNTRFRLKREQNCLKGCFEALVLNHIPCCLNNIDIEIQKEDFSLISSSTLERSSSFHYQQCIGINCCKGQWSRARINLNNPTISCIEKCLFIGAWYYFIEFCK